MPTYDYECQKCHQTFEFVQSMKDPVLKICPKDRCKAADGVWGEGQVKRLLGTGAGFIFKGSGFYITDYRSENYKAKAKSESAGATQPPAPTPPTSTPGSSSAGSAGSTSTAPAAPASKPSSSAS